MRRAVLLLTAVLALTACTDAEVVYPESADEGIQATGTLDGARIAISRANPTVTVGDCDPQDGRDRDLCVGARTIDGLDVTLVVENPDALAEGVVLEPVAECAGPCDDVTDGVVLDLVVDGDVRRVVSGRLDVRSTGERWTADFDIALRGGDRLIGTFDVAG